MKRRLPIADIFENFIALLMPKSLTGGIEISDSSIRFLSVKKGKTISAVLRLPPGLIAEGKIKDYKNVVAALSAIKNQVEPRPHKKVNVVAAISSASVYVQTFQLPLVAKENLESAAQFNLKVLSPLGQEVSYSDWQLVGESQDQFELLAAFAPGAVIDEYMNAMREAGFNVFAVEFSSLALIRLIKNAGAAVDAKLPAIILNLLPEGLDFMIMRNGNLYFDYFQPWKVTQEGWRQINWADFQTTVVSEVQRILNFYNSHWGKIENFILITPAFYDRLSALITERFGLKVQPLTVYGYEGFSPSWFIVLGATLRSMLPRYRDNFLSLMSTSARHEYFQEELLVLVNFWRNVLAAVLIFTIAISFAAIAILSRVHTSLQHQLRGLAGEAFNTAEIEKLQEEAEQFNRLVDIVAQVKAQRIDWVALVEKIFRLAGPRITIDRISVPGASQQIRITGNALNEASVFEFERNISAQEEFTNINLPISSIQRTVGGRWAFELTFTAREVFFLK